MPYLDQGEVNYLEVARAAMAAMAPERIAGIAPFNAAIDAVAAAEGALCRARENVDVGDHASIDAELANLRRARGGIHEARAGVGSADGWRDIASAPKDGSRFLASFVCSTSNAQVVVADVAWHRDHWCSDGDGIIEPTRWQPLPSPPTEQEPQ